MPNQICINELAKRQTAESRFSHFEGSMDDLAKLVEASLNNAKPGYKDGVWLVPVPPTGFFSGVVELTEATPLKAEFSARRKGEDLYINVVAVGGEKLPAKVVEVVIYRHDVLGDDASTDSEWEVVSINARPTEESEPMTPVAMARNFLELPGGTKAEYTAQQFAEAIIYWSKRAMRG
jgi:hypothetical protein